MPSFPLIVRGMPLTQRVGQPDQIRFEHGVLPLTTPLTGPPLVHVLNLRLSCNYRIPRVPGVREAILDTGAPLSLIPRWLWRDQFNWREGVHFDVCHFVGLGPWLDAQLLGTSFRCRIVRLKVPVEVAGTNLRGPRFSVENMIAQLPEADAPTFTLFGLWGGVFDGRRLVVDRVPTADALTARFEW